MPIQTTHIHAHTKHPTFTHKHTTHITDAHVCTHTQSIHTTHARILHMHTLHSARTHTYTCKHTYHVHVHLNTPRHTAYSHAHHIHTHKHTHLHLEHQIDLYLGQIMPSRERQTKVCIVGFFLQLNLASFLSFSLNKSPSPSAEESPLTAVESPFKRAFWLCSVPGKRKKMKFH